ncbi:MAG: hypothetical protein E7158_03610 [Firmicutes bacterium]|nr:hypothetical protein [Bacillota bacterium]
MDIKSFKKKKNNKYDIFFKDGKSIELYDDVILKYNLLLDKKIEDSMYDEIILYNSSLDAYYLSIKYLSSKMHTKLEINKYLEKKEFSASIIKETIEKLEKNKLINENEYLKAFVNDQIKFTKNGPHKIANKLHLLGIEKENIYDYLSTIEDSIWEEKIKKLIDKKIQSNRNYSEIVLKNKILQSISNEGYDRNMINLLLKDYDNISNPNIIIKEYNKQKRKLSKKFDGDALEFQIKMKLKAKGFNFDDLKKHL